MSTQLLNEKLSKEEFKKKIRQYGLTIIKEYFPQQNKKELTSCDFLCKIITKNNLGNKEQIIKVSLKTRGGLFTIFNSGLTLQANLFKHYCLSESEKELIKDIQRKVNRLKKETLVSF